MRDTVSAYQPVAAEITETRNSFGTVVPTIRPIPTPIRVYLTERLVYPVPHATALCHRIIFEHIPILLQATYAVAHGVHVFAKNERTVNIFLCQIGFDFIDTAVHPAINIGVIILLGTFVLNGTILFYRFQPVIGTFEVNSVSGFVTQRPNDDGRMVLRTLVHTVCTIHVCCQPSAVLGKRSRTVAHTVRLDVGLVDHIKSVAIAKLIPVRMSGIM